MAKYYKSKFDGKQQDALLDLVAQGGSGGGGSDWHYFDISALDNLSKMNVFPTAMLHKVQGEKIETAFGSGLISPTGFGYVTSIDATEIKAVAMDFTAKILMGGRIATIGESITTAPWYGQVPEITEEQFYTL